MAKTEYDFTSADPVLHYSGKGSVAAAPAADLTANTLRRLAWIRAGALGSPDAITNADITALRDELVATGIYSTEASK